MGAGSSGSVIANRLSENPKWSILLLEAGGTPTFLSRIPILASLTQYTRNNWNYFTEPQENACRGYLGNRCPVVRGKVLGGTSQLNYMIYSRGHPKDFDRWAEMGNEGWSYQEILKYFLKSERSHMKHNVIPKLHGKTGLQDTSFARWAPNRLIQAYMAAWKDFGYKQVDYNGVEQVGYSEIQTLTKNGERADALTEFLMPIRNRANLKILQNSFVLKILIDGDSGVWC